MPKAITLPYSLCVSVAMDVPQLIGLHGRAVSMSRLHWNCAAATFRVRCDHHSAPSGFRGAKIEGFEAQPKSSSIMEATQTRQRWQWILKVSYDGTAYAGWQSQRNAITVQETIEKVLAQITRCPPAELSVSAASRTDAGVHAWGQVVSFWTPFAFEQLELLHYSLNAMLPHDIRIREVHAVDLDFHVRYHPTSKIYQYKAYVGPVMDPFQRSCALHVPFIIDAVAMQEAASLLIGKHNFSAFANSSPKALLSPIREIYKFTVFLSGPHLLLEVQGKSFLYKQVRNMVGLLLEVGKGTLPSRAVSDVLASCSRDKLALLSSCAPGHGLNLMSINYNEELFLHVPKPSYGRQRKLRERASYPLA